MKREFLGFAFGFIVVLGATQVADRMGPGVDVFAPVKGLMNAITPAAKADEPAVDGAETAKPKAFPDLVRINDQDYRLTVADYVSMTPLSSSHVRKIGYGNVSEVRVVTTSTGTYSTDGLASPNVLYPGITVTPVRSPASAGTAMLAMMREGLWFAVPMSPAHSFVHFGPMQGGGHYVTSKDSTCVFGKNFAGCI